MCGSAKHTLLSPKHLPLHVSKIWNGGTVFSGSIFLLFGKESKALLSPLHAEDQKKTFVKSPLITEILAVVSSIAGE